MNWDRIEGNWKQVTGKANVQWGKLTDNDLDVIAGTDVAGDRSVMALPGRGPRGSSPSGKARLTIRGSRSLRTALIRA